MKTITKPRIIPAEPAYEVEDTSYECEECDFKTDDQEAAEKHYGREHCAADKWEIGDHTIYRFDTIEKAQAWWKAHEGGADCKETFEPKAPGWYALRSENRPCGRGCCSSWWEWLEPAYMLLEQWESEASEFGEKIQKLEHLLYPMSM